MAARSQASETGIFARGSTEYVNQGSVATNSALTGLAGAGLSPGQALGNINRLIDQQACMFAANDVFYVSALIFLLLIPLVYLTKHSKGGGGRTLRRARTEAVASGLE